MIQAPLQSSRKNMIGPCNEELDSEVDAVYLLSCARPACQYTRLPEDR